MVKITNTIQLLLLCLFEFVLSSCKKNENIETPTVNVSTTTQKMSGLLLASTSTPSGSGFMLGVNGHLGDAPYMQTPANKQVQLLNEMGMKWYRINIQTNSDYSMRSEGRFLALYQAASEKGVSLLPVLYTRTLDLDKTEAESYKSGWELGANFAAKYGGYFTYYDLGNDLELALLTKNKTGQSQEHYDRRKTNVTAAYLKGMDE